MNDEQRTPTREPGDDIEFSLSILRPKPGDFLVLTVPANISPDQAGTLSHAIDACLRALGLQDTVRGVILQGEQTLASVSPEQMAKLGWVRKK